MKTVRDIVNRAEWLNNKVLMNVDGKDIEIKEILVDCLDGTVYLYDRDLDEIE